MIIGVTGGKGGTGKSSIATALAALLAKKGKVLLVDADVDCPNDHLLLGIELQPLKEVTQRIPYIDQEKCKVCGACNRVCKTGALIRRKEKKPSLLAEQCNGCGACLLACPHHAITWTNKVIGSISRGSNHGVDLLSGQLKPKEPISEFVVNDLVAYMQEQEEKYAHIIIDTAAGTHCPVIAALTVCDSIYAVTEPTPLGTHDLNLILQVIEKLGKKAQVILNKADDNKITEKIISEYGVVISIPYDTQVAKSYAQGVPLDIPTLEDITKVLE